MKIKLTSQQIQVLIDSYKNGDSTKTLSSELNVCDDTILNIFRKAGFKLKPPSERLKESWNNPIWRQSFISKVSGVNNYGYKGDKAPLSKKIKGLTEYARWRGAILDRDNLTCQECGYFNQVGKERIPIHVDHIYPFAKIMDDCKIQSIEDALNCSVLWDKSNGRCLCEKCHKSKTHNK